MLMHGTCWLTFYPGKYLTSRPISSLKANTLEVLAGRGHLRGTETPALYQQLRGRGGGASAQRPCVALRNLK